MCLVISSELAVQPHYLNMLFLDEWLMLKTAYFAMCYIKMSPAFDGANVGPTDLGMHLLDSYRDNLFHLSSYYLASH